MPEAEDDLGLLEAQGKLAASTVWFGPANLGARWAPCDVRPAANMRTYLLLKERAEAFRADPEVQQAMVDAGVPALATPTLSPGETFDDVLGDRGAFEDYDVERAGAPLRP